MTTSDEQNAPTPAEAVADVPLSERLRAVAEQKTTSWPEDDYVPHENARGRHAVADAMIGGAIVQGGVGRL